MLWPINKKKMRKIILALMLISTIPTFGQNHFIGLKSGINWTTVKWDHSNDPSNKRTGFNGGLTYQYIINNNFSVGLDMLYDQKGFKNNIIAINPSGEPIGPKAEIDFNYDYLSFPIKMGYSIGNTILGFINLGVVPAFIVNAETIVATFDQSKTIDHTNLVTSFDLGGLVEVGGSYAVLDRLLITTSIAYQHSFNTLSNSDYFSDSNMKHYGMTLSIGVKYALKNK